MPHFVFKVKDLSTLQKVTKMFANWQEGKFYAYLKVTSLPDSTTKTIMVDNMNQIDMSTFLSTGDILIRCGYRFLIFDCDGFTWIKREVSYQKLHKSKFTKLGACLQTFHRKFSWFSTFNET